MRIDLEVVPENQPSDIPVECRICPASFVEGVVIASAYSDGEMYFGPVCPRCLAAGPEGMRENLDVQAVLTRFEADAVEEVAREDIAAPTIEHLKQLEEIAAL
jgi:hypothetical protein